MRLFIDTNVVMDAIIPGRSGRQEALEVISLHKNLEFRLRIMSLSVANIAYIARKYISKAETIEYINQIYKEWKIVPLTDMDIRDAMQSACPDFEDALQISAAEMESDVIVTGNKKHFAPYTALPVYTPAEFLAKLREHQLSD